jgi:hypothetical protein
MGQPEEAHVTGRRAEKAGTQQVRGRDLRPEKSSVRRPFDGQAGFFNRTMGNGRERGRRLLSGLLSGGGGWAASLSSCSRRAASVSGGPASARTPAAGPR